VSGDDNAKDQGSNALCGPGNIDEDTPGETRSKLMRGCGGHVGVTGTPKDPEMFIGRGVL
jgi:hypothetical protein